MYLNDIAKLIRSHIPDGRMPDSGGAQLLLSYALLLRAKGVNVTNSDVHDAWAAWMVGIDPNHEALIPYGELPPDIQEEDLAFATAVRRAAEELQFGQGSRPEFGEILFPSGPPSSEHQSQQALDLYKIMVQSSESLVARRQGVNTFFLTMNGALLTAYGLIVQTADFGELRAAGIAVLGLAGVVLCFAWRSLIVSFGQLNRGKFSVINTIERYLQVAIYAAEWEALGRGEDPKTYRSFTSREIWVPNALVVIHAVVLIIALLGAFHCLNIAASDGAV
jgi:hypothetical protein